ncbi:MAG: hypothetical protein ACOC85_03690 [Thermoplasmatota archaeon]
MYNWLLDIQLLWVVLLTVYAVLITLSTRYVYGLMIDRGIEKNIAIYYDRKLVHIFAGGLALLLIPYLFDSPVYPLIIRFFTNLVHIYTS